MSRYIRLFFILLFIIFPVMPLFAQDIALAKLTYGEDMWLAAHYLLQAQLFTHNVYDKKAGESSSDGVWSQGFQIRRSRLILNGQISKSVEFLMQTDDIFIGSGKTPGDSSDAGKRIYTQDAYIRYKITKAFEIDGGLMPLPFMHQDMESAVSLLGLDYNITVNALSGNSTVFRDTGLQARIFLQKAVEFRLGAFRGQTRDLNNAGTEDDVNKDGIPRFCGRVQFNFLDPEDGFFYSGNYLGKKSVFAVGGGIDFQPNASRVNGSLDHYFAWTGDVTVDYKVSDNLVGIFQGAYVNARNKPETELTDEIEEQWGFFIQTGALLYNIVQPVIRYQYWKGNTTFSGDSFVTKNVKISYLNIGLNYFLKGHNANVKLEYQQPLGKDNKSVSGEKKVTLQGQIYI